MEIIKPINKEETAAGAFPPLAAFRTGPAHWRGGGRRGPPGRGLGRQSFPGGSVKPGALPHQPSHWETSRACPESRSAAFLPSAVTPQLSPPPVTPSQPRGPGLSPLAGYTGHGSGLLWVFPHLRPPLHLARTAQSLWTWPRHSPDPARCWGLAGCITGAQAERRMEKQNLILTPGADSVNSRGGKPCGEAFWCYLCKRCRYWLQLWMKRLCQCACSLPASP